MSLRIIVLSAAPVIVGIVCIAAVSTDAFARVPAGTKLAFTITRFIIAVSIIVDRCSRTKGARETLLGRHARTCSAPWSPAFVRGFCW